MRPFRHLLHRLRDLVHRDRLEGELDDELAFHLRKETEENRRRGMAPEEALRAARRSLGMAERIKEDARRQHGFGRLELLWQDARQALRALRRRPGFTAAAVAVLALGIGADTAIFSVVHGVLLRPLALPEPDRVVQLLGADRVDGIGWGTISYPNFVDVRERAESFSALSAFDEWNVLAEWPGADGAEKVSGASVSPSFFEVLGVPPAHGRWLSEDEGEPGSARSVVLSHDLWKRRFGADPAAVGTAVEINGHTYEIVGVAPSGLEDTGLAGDSWDEPILWRSPPGYFATGMSRDGRAMTAVGRLAPGVGVDQANAELDAIMLGLEREYPEDNPDKTMIAVPLEERIVGDLRRPLWLLLGAALLVLLVACGNVANLLLARATGRSGEVAVRAAIGASRGRIVRHLAVESLALAFAGAALGVAVAAAGVEILSSLGADRIPRWEGVGIDLPVLTFAAGLALVTALLCGTAPARRLARGDLAGTIRGAHSGATEGRGRSGFRSAMVAGQVALSLVLLAGSGLLVRSLVSLERVDPGFGTEELLSARLTLPPGPYDEAPAAAALYRELLERAAALPGAESAAAINILPFSGGFDGRAFSIDGRPEPPPGDRPMAELRAVTPGFFDTAGIPLLAGRALETADRAGGSPVVVVDETAAGRFWPGQSALGERISFMDTSWEVVGVVGGLHHTRLDRPLGPTIYAPAVQTPAWLWDDSALLVRTAVEPSLLARDLERTIRSVGPGIAVDSVAPMDRVLGETLGQERFRTLLLAAFAGLALLLSAVGLYGVVAYATAGRARELGIRMALGAGRRRVVATVMAQGLLPAVAGTVAGLAGAALLVHLLAGTLDGLLYGVEPWNPATALAAAAVLLAAAALATYLPARRAARLDPAHTLRAE